MRSVAKVEAVRSMRGIVMKSFAAEAPGRFSRMSPEARCDPSSGHEAGAPSTLHPRPLRRRGRPIEMSPEDLLERIRALASRKEGLFRVHHTHPSLYARSRRLFGSWEGAVRASGLDYRQIVEQAVQRAVRARRRAPRRPLVTLP